MLKIHDKHVDKHFFPLIAGRVPRVTTSMNARHGEMDQALEKVTGIGAAVAARAQSAGLAVYPGTVKERAVGVYEEAIDVANDAGVHNTVQWATADLGLTLLALGRVEEASACFARAGAVSDQVGDDAGKLLAAYGAAIVAQQDGDHATARPLFDSACRGFERLGVPLATGLALAGVAGCDELAGDAAGARAGYQRPVTLGETASEAGVIAAGLEGLACAGMADSDAYETARLLGRASWLRTTYGRPATPPEQEAAGRTEASARAALGEQRYDAAARQRAETGLGTRS